MRQAHHLRGQVAGSQRGELYALKLGQRGTEKFFAGGIKKTKRPMLIK